MKDSLPRYTLRIPQILLDKLTVVAAYEGRTKNKEIEQLIKRRIAEFEAEHGAIEGPVGPDVNVRPPQKR